jgi:CDP-diacylglycerol--glycerol-3-phosphate 3-phosphatidyltransferase
MIDGRREGRAGAAGSTRPDDAAPPRTGIGHRLVRLGISADHVTVAGVVLSAVNAVVIGRGYLYVACALLIVGGLMDTLDGVVAKAAGTSSPRGAFFDSVADRVSDSFLLGGLAYYLATGHHPREALLPVAILAVGSVISYERAKAESLGFSGKGGLMERAERLIVFGLAMLVHVVMIEILWVLLVLTTITAVGRFVRIWRQASGAPPPRPLVVAGAWRRGRVESRWRPLRETGSALPPRLATAPGARWRNRRRTATLSTRLRSVLSTQDAGRARPARPARNAGSSRSARAMRRRIDDGRSR